MGVTCINVRPSSQIRSFVVLVGVDTTHASSGRTELVGLIPFAHCMLWVNHRHCQSCQSCQGHDRGRNTHQNEGRGHRGGFSRNNPLCVYILGGSCRRWGLGTDIRMRVMARTVMIRYHSRNGHLRSNCGRRWPSSQLRSRTGSRSSNHRCRCKYLHEDHDIYPVLVLDVPNISSSFLMLGLSGLAARRRAS